MESGILIAVTVGVSQISKNLGLKCKSTPLFNLVLGILMSAFFMADLSLSESVL